MKRLNHGIYLESEPGKGTKVYLNLARKKKEALLGRILQKCKVWPSFCNLKLWQEALGHFILDIIKE